MARQADIVDHLIKECERLSQPEIETTMNELAKLRHEAVLYLLGLGTEFDAIREKVEGLSFQPGRPPISPFVDVGPPVVPASWSAAGQAKALLSEYVSGKLDELKKLLLIAKARNKSTTVGKVSDREPVPPPGKRRVRGACADFDQTVGKWMHDEHVKLRNSGISPTRGRSTPNMNSKTFIKLVTKAQRATRRKQSRFPMKEVLSKKEWSLIAEYNRKHNKKLTWLETARMPEFKRMIRHRFNRAEIYYRTHPDLPPIFSPGIMRLSPCLDSPRLRL